MAVLVSTKKTKTVDFELCLICQIGSKQTYYKNYVINRSIGFCGEAVTGVWRSYGETKLSSLLRNGVSYHKTCYKDLTHKINAFNEQK